jgi:hypothetical protein
MIGRRAATVSLLAAAMMLPATPLFAQSRGAALPRVELGVGALWIGRASLGATTATETRGTGSKSVLFESTGELGGAPAVEGRIGIRLSRLVVAEAVASYSKPPLRVAISADAEGGAALTAAETISQFTLGGRVLWYVPGKRWTPRFAPFAMGGGGYLRQLHEQGTLAETGRYYEIGGGVSALLASRRHWRAKGAGIRADVRALIRSRATVFDGGSTTSPAAGISAFVRF